MEWCEVMENVENVGKNLMLDGIESLFQGQEVNVQQKIVQELLSVENLDRKTELDKPLKWSCLTTIEEFVKKYDLKFSANIINKFTDLSFRYLISKNRKGRSEYVEALKTFNQAVPNIEKSKMEKMMN